MGETAKYPLAEDQKLDMMKRFTYHKPVTESQVQRYVEIRQHAHDLALRILESTPKSREQSLAITHLEDVVMWANAAIARNE